MKIKKLPVLTYICYLLLVGAALTGVTFSRYVFSSENSTGAVLNRFICSYDIGDMSAVTFSNADYWQNFGTDDQTTMNMTRSVKFTVRNHTLDADGGVDRISDVAIDSTLRFYAPAEFTGNLAIQIAEEDENGEYTAVTPQYVLGNLIYGITEDPDTGLYTYENENRDDREFAVHDGNTVIYTEKFIDYNARTYGGTLDEALKVSGGFYGTAESHEGVITAYSEESGNRITITSEVKDSRYSVGFLRGKEVTVGGVTVVESTSPPLYIDCLKSIPYYTLDIQLPGMNFTSDGTAQSRTYVLFITVLEETVNSDYSSLWSADMEEIFTDPSAGEYRTFNGAVIEGYHFDHRVAIADGSGNFNGEYTTVRVSRKYDYDNGGSMISVMHVAPLSEGATSVVHPIYDFYRWNGYSYESFDPDMSDAGGIQDLYAVCSNGSGYIYFEDVPDDPHYDSYTGQISGEEPLYNISEALSKGYHSTLNVLFSQASESGKG